MNSAFVAGSQTDLAPRHFLSQPETIRVLAAMVAFQEDSDPGTTGNGSFDLSDTLNRVLDTPPHNRSYFDRHMTFLKNYYVKVSDGKFVIEYTLLTDVFRLHFPMRHYSPSKRSTTNTELANLAQDAWRLIDSSTSVAFDQYDAFVLFHAGAGRDIDLVNICGGYDPTPYDIPPLYLNLSSLKKVFGTSYEGIPVQQGTKPITNSIIVPETESRYLDCVGGTLRLGINGLLAASIGSYLGLPDLFDTKTGASGIGRFGLMDGQSIFSWEGAFPPEPSAWERYFLGWIQPITISSGDDVYALPAISLVNHPDTVYRVPISDREYFLIENRNRDANRNQDANRDGATVTMVIHDSTITRTWYRDTVHFNAFSTSALVGVVTDVDEFDWSLPGGVNTRTGEWFDGGILIWHIDENIIDAMIATDAVNADPARRGVDLEEADGSQDIGQSYGLLDPGSGSEDGTQLDFWYYGNKAPLRLQSNEFTPTTFPDSRSNNLGNSHVYIRGFSPRGPRMTVIIQVGDEQASALNGFPKKVQGVFGKNSIAVRGDAGPQLFVATTTNFGTMYGWNYDGTSLNGFPSSGVLVTIDGPINSRFLGTPVIYDLNHDNSIDFVMAGWFRAINDLSSTPFIGAWTATDNDHDVEADSFFGKNIPFHFTTTSPVLSDSLIAVGLDNGTLKFIDHNGGAVSEIAYFIPDTVVGLSLWDKRDVYLETRKGGLIATLTATGPLKAHQLSKTLSASAVVANFSSLNARSAAVASADGYVYLLDDSLNVVDGFPAMTGGEILNSPAIADIDGDGRKDIIVFSGNKIFAINSTGVILDHFPIETPTTTTILTSPIVADVNGDGLQDIVGVTQEGLVVAYDKTGKLLSGFPLQTGTNNGSTPAAFYMPSPCLSCTDIGLAVASEDGNVYAWKTGTLRTGLAIPLPMPWPQYMHDAQNTGLDESTPQSGKPISQQFFPAERAYNWPNPVGRENGFKTHIRYYVGTSAAVHIKIFDVAGDLVQEMQGQAVGGIDNEMEWDVSNIQSGIYLAHIDVDGVGGTGNAVIKIAVVK